MTTKPKADTASKKRKKTIRSMHAVSECTEHLINWQVEASAKGWSERDIDSLLSILKIAKNEERVVEINTSVIHLLSVGEYRLGGVSRNGDKVESVVPYSKPWTWIPNKKVISIISPRGDSEQKSWCPKHGDGCGPNHAGCGVHDVIGIETCSCGKYHDRQCEVGRRIAEERVESEVKAMQDRERLALEPVNPNSAWVAPKVKRKRPTKATGWLLPGQVAMDLGATPVMAAVHDAEAGNPKK